MNPDLASITARISKLIKIREASDYELAGLVLQAKEEHFSGDSLGWLAWCENNWQFARRHCFALAKVASFMRDLLANHPDFSARAALKFEHAYEIAVIPPARAMEFIAAHPTMDHMDRDEVRDAVRIFLGRKPATPIGQQDFFAKLNLPAPEQFRAEVQKSLATMPAARSADYGSILLHAAVQKRDQLSPADRRQLLTNLATFSADLLERDATPFIQHFTKLL